MLEIDALNKRSVKLIVSFLLCFVFVFSFFVMTIEKSEAIATIPLVAIPIIKLLIASGVTFLSVDAMLEVYNQIKGTEYYNTLTGNILNVLDDLSEDLVSSWLFHDWAMQQPDPPGSGWPEWPELLLGTLCLETAKSDNFFQDFLDWFGGFKDDLIITTIEQNLPEEIFPFDYNIIYYETINCAGHVCISCDSPIFFGGAYNAFDIPNGVLYQTSKFCNNKCPLISPPGYYYIGPIKTKSSGYCLFYPRIATTIYYSSNHTIYEQNSDEIYAGASVIDLSFLDNPNYNLSLDLDDYIGEEIIDIEIDEMEISDDNFQNDDSEEKVEIYVPMPNEIITYDPDTGLDIDFDTEISIEEFEELMTPYVGSTWEDIKQDKPIPSKIPTDVPYPDDPVVPDPLIPEMPDLEEEDLPPDAGEGDDPFAGADEEEKIDWDPLKGINLHKKFPFCIPWDLYDSFKSFNVQGEPPKWEIKYLDDVEFIIDFAIFEPWAVIVRWGLLIIFNIGLIIITRNLIRG